LQCIELRNLLEQSSEDFENEVKEIFKNAEHIRDLCITEGQQKTLTITARFNSERLMDGWLEVPLVQWTINADYGTRTILLPFRFNNIQPSESYAYH
jgi:hypothetical protein